jgi:ribosomal biogenesis protein LAS1
LDVAFSQARRRGGDESQEWKSREEVKTEIQAIMKSYVRARKIEITMSRTTASFEAAQTAFGTYTTLLSASERACTHQTLLDLLVTEKAILPSDKKLGSRMSGAFIVWSPLLVLLCSTPSLHSTSLVVSLVRRFLQAMNGPSPFGVEKEEDPVKEGMHAWLLRVSTHPDFMGPRALAGNGWETKFVENVLADLCVAPSSWNLKALEGILDAHEDLPNREAWVSVLDAAMDEGEEEEVDMEGEGLRSEEISIEEQVQEELEAEAENEGTEAQSARVKVKTIGPQKRVGLWRPTYIGVLPVGWEDDE